MGRKSWIISLALLFSLTLGLGCGEIEDEGGLEEDGPHALPDLDFGKSDNYIGTNAREFILSGEASVELPDGFETLADEDRELLLEELIENRVTTIGHSVESHIKDVIRDYNQELTDAQIEFFTYFRSDNLQTDTTDVDVVEDRGVFSFEMELVGSVRLMSIVAPDNTTRRTFEVGLRTSRWSSEIDEVIEVEIKGSPSSDSFPRYDELFADGYLDIAIHFGGDYNSGRYDLETAKWTVEVLLENEWENEEASSFEDLRIDSGPFTQTVFVEGQDVEVRIFVYHSEMKDDEVNGSAVGHQGLREAVEYSMLNADIFVYSGHAGTNAGFILDYSPRYEISASEFAAMDMSDKYQIYIMDGCNTYRTYVGDIMENPARDFANTDIMTTVHTTPFSAGYDVIWRLMYWFTFTDRNGGHFPMSWQTMIRGLNQDFPDVHYGVHGVDDGPKLNPHASEGLACRPCSRDSDCGAGGNYCLGFADGAACSVGCTTDAACGEGFRCARIFDIDDQFYIPRQCVPQSMSCR